jgi:predicted nucleic acid-binding protein
MIVVLDTKCLVCWSRKDDENMDAARLDGLLAEVTAARGRIVLPTPVVAEFLVRTDEATAEWLHLLNRKPSIQVAAFDLRSAVECALLDAAAIAKGDKRGGRKDPYQQIKVDRQIVAIAKTNNASVVVTDDRGLTTTCRAAGIEVRPISELALPAEAAQRKLAFHGDDQRPANGPSKQAESRPGP